MTIKLFITRFLYRCYIVGFLLVIYFSWWVYCIIVLAISRKGHIKERTGLLDS